MKRNDRRSPDRGREEESMRTDIFMAESMRRDLIRRKNRRMRTRQLRFRVAATVAAFLIFLSGLSLSTIFSRAQDRSVDVSCKYFTSIQIRPGDTLYSIACQYADGHYASVYAYMKEVCLINHLTDDALHAGNYLVIPCYSADVLAEIISE